MSTAGRLTDMVRQLIPQWRQSVLSPTEMDLAVDLRGNERLYNALTTIVQSRITGRASLPVPSNPDDCRAFLERDRECQWMINRFALVYRSAVNSADSGEPPAA